MNRRRFLKITAASATGVAAVGAGGWWAWDEVCRMSLAVDCQSDNLSVVAKHLREYAEKHEGRFPPAADLRAVARGDYESYLSCRQVGLPYQWDLRLAGTLVVAAEGRAIAWCPPGGHGRYVGAIVVSDRELRVVGITVAELRGWV
jgi:hypothetical protein